MTIKREQCLRVFTYGSPPTFTTTEEKTQDSIETCAILDTLELPQDIVLGYSQPWDPVPRLFTQYDPLYPLVDDLGEGEIYPGIQLMFFYTFRCAYSSISQMELLRM